jgi:hypothetical protein
MLKVTFEMIAAQPAVRKSLWIGRVRKSCEAFL